MEGASLKEHATALAGAIEEALPRWVERSVLRLASEGGIAVGEELRARAATAGRRAADDVGPRVRALLAADVADQRTTPLALVRSAVRFPTEVLQGAGLTPVPRDRGQVRLFPGDVYDLAPATWADVDPSLVDPGMTWGAAKAHVHLARHRP